MDHGLELQLRESLGNVNRHRSRLEEYPISTLNLAILIIGFISIAVGYILNNIPQETILQIFSGHRVAIERPSRAVSAAEALTKFPDSLARLLIG